MNIDAHEIVLEVLKAAIAASVGWLFKMHSDVKSLRSDMDAAFCKIRTLEEKSDKPR